MVEAGRHRLEAGGGGAARHLGGQRRGRDIDVTMRQAEQRIAELETEDPRRRADFEALNATVAATTTFLRANGAASASTCWSEPSICAQISSL